MPNVPQIVARSRSLVASRESKRFSEGPRLGSLRWEDRQAEPSYEDLFADIYRCKHDAAYFLDRYCWFRPQEGGSPQPMRLAQYQIDKIIEPYGNAIETQTGLLWQKSRRMRFTWTMSALELHRLTFWRGSTGLIIAKNEDQVDDGGENSTDDSIFGKLRYIWDRLPDHIKQPIVWKSMSAFNPFLGSFIAGSAASGTAGRGSGFERIWWDEAAHTQNDRLIWASISSATKCVLMDSSVFGMDNVFAELRHADPPPLKVIVIHWSMDPAKDMAWYKIQAAKIGIPEIVASELDMSYDRSLTGRIYPEFSSVTHVLETADYDKRLPLYRCWDFGTAAPCAVAYFQIDKTREIRVVDEIQETNQTAAGIAALCHLKDKEQGWKVHTDYGDIGGKARNSQGTSWIVDLEAEGISVETRSQSVSEGIALVRKAVIKGPGAEGLVVHPRCRKFIAAMLGYRWPDSQRNDDDKPLHSIHSHMMDAFRYGIVGRFGGPLAVWGSQPRSY